MPDLPLSGVIGAAVGLAVGVLDYGLLAGLIRRMVARPPETIDPARVDRVLKGVFVVNALVFAALGWWVGVSVSGIGIE
jgi:hypothetical protein